MHQPRVLATNVGCLVELPVDCLSELTSLVFHI